MLQLMNRRALILSPQCNNENHKTAQNTPICTLSTHHSSVSVSIPSQKPQTERGTHQHAPWLKMRTVASSALKNPNNPWFPCRYTLLHTVTSTCWLFGAPGLNRTAHGSVLVYVLPAPPKP